MIGDNFPEASIPRQIVRAVCKAGRQGSLDAAFREIQAQIYYDAACGRRHIEEPVYLDPIHHDKVVKRLRELGYTVTSKKRDGGDYFYYFDLKVKW
jgi:hypothetical protein